VWDATKSRWLVEIRYPDGSRFRKRMRREREALRLWAAEQAKIENEDGSKQRRDAEDVYEIDDPVKPHARIAHEIAEGRALEPPHEMRKTQRTLSANSGYTV